MKNDNTVTAMEDKDRIKELEATNLALISRMQELEERRALVARNRELEAENEELRRALKSPLGL